MARFIYNINLFGWSSDGGDGFVPESCLDDINSLFT
jgi:hypothetical protein